MRILVTGTRSPLSPAMASTVTETLREAVRGKADVVIVHGACPTGVDDFVDGAAKLWCIAVERYPADWEAHGRMAGPIRNSQMVRLGADLCLAFPHGASRGTRGCAELAMRAGIPTKVVEL